jgi:hypothetical protein
MQTQGSSVLFRLIFFELIASPTKSDRYFIGNRSIKYVNENNNLLRLWALTKVIRFSAFGGLPQTMSVWPITLQGGPISLTCCGVGIRRPG